MNQKPTSISCRSLSIRLSSWVLQFSAAGSHNRSSAAAGRAASSRLQTQRATRLMPDLYCERGAGRFRGVRRQKRRASVDAATALEKITESRSEEHTSELQSQSNLVCRLLLEKKNSVTALATSRRPSSESACSFQSDAEFSERFNCSSSVVIRAITATVRNSTRATSARRLFS